MGDLQGKTHLDKLTGCRMANVLVGYVLPFVHVPPSGCPGYDSDCRKGLDR